MVEAWRLARKFPKYGTKVRVVSPDVCIPPSALSVEKGEILLLGSLDGMYVNALDSLGRRVYIAAWTEVEKCE